MNKALRISYKTLLAITGVLVVFHLVENWRGKRVYSAWKQQREDAGLPLDWAGFTPPPVPEVDNFAAVPLIDQAVKGKGWGVSFAPLTPALQAVDKNGDWRTNNSLDLKAVESTLGKDLPSALSPYEGVLKTVAEAARRPQSRFLINYENPAEIPPPLLEFRALMRTLRLRALVHLKEGRTDLAFEDLQTGLRMARHFRREPHLLAQLLRVAWLNLIIQPLWEGIQDHRWNDTQLKALQDQLNEIDVLEPWQRSLRCEQIYLVHFGEEGWWTAFKAGQHWTQGEAIGRWNVLLRSIVMPKGWLLQNRTRSLQLYDQGILSTIDPVGHCVYPERYREMQQMYSNIKRTPYTFMTANMIPAIANQAIRIARLQVGLDQAQVACTLERYRLAKKSYPASLEELRNGFISTLPKDLVNGEPMRYAKTPEGGYRLWSVGWDCKDDGGQRAADPKILESGDWCWTVAK